MYAQLLIKMVDVAMQLLAVFIPLCSILFLKDGGWFPYTYFTLGGVQIISCVFNAINKDEFTRARSRTPYERTLIILAFATGASALATLTGIVIPLFAMMVVLAIAGIVLGIWYLVLSIKELDLLQRLEERKKFQ